MSGIVVVKYKTKPEAADENERLIKGVHAGETGSNPLSDGPAEVAESLLLLRTAMS